MNKVEMMDKYLETYTKEITSTEICYTVDSIFKFNLDQTPILSSTKEAIQNVSLLGNDPTPREVIDLYIKQYKGELTGKEIRQIINEVFGVNLDAISSLETARISLYSKGKWVVQSEHDLFVVYTGPGDIDVKVYPTNYFTEQTGLTKLPVDLQRSLTSLGFCFDETLESYYFKNPTGKAISDAFKGKTMGAILDVIQRSFSDF
jgi:hypothetical protein